MRKTRAYNVRMNDVDLRFTAVSSDLFRNAKIETRLPPQTRCIDAYTSQLIHPLARFIQAYHINIVVRREGLRHFNDQPLGAAGVQAVNDIANSWFIVFHKKKSQSFS